jgi:dihydropteroate synthase
MALAAQARVDIVRVHDVREMVDVVRLTAAVVRGPVS